MAKFSKSIVGTKFQREIPLFLVEIPNFSKSKTQRSIRKSTKTCRPTQNLPDPSSRFHTIGLPPTCVRQTHKHTTNDARPSIALHG